MRIPEWEIRDAICWNPKLLGINAKLVGFQIHLKGMEERKFIDILFKTKDKFLIVEHKKDEVTKFALDQVLNYKKLFCAEKALSEKSVDVMVAAPHISQERKWLCHEREIKNKE